jgi:hypothetical protein
MPSLPDFNGRRLHLANAFRDWRTAQEAADELGTETGSVFGLIKRMHAEGILEADSDPAPPTRGTQYRLKHEARVVLDELLAQIGDEHQEPGHLEADQRLLVARGNSLVGLETALADPALSTAVAWVAWMGSSWLFAMKADCEAHTLRRLATVLEQAGYECERGRVDELQAGHRFRAQSTANLERAGVGR